MTRKGLVTVVDWSHKLLSLVLLPFLLYVAQGVWTEFKENNTRLTKIEAALAIQIPHLQEADRQHDQRITRVEGWVFGRDR